MTPAFLVVAAAVLFGTTGTAQAFAPEGASPLSVGAARLVLGGTLLAVIALLSVRRASRRAAALRAAGEADLSGRGRWGAARFIFAVVGALGVAAYQPAFFAGTATNGVAIGTVVALGSAPVFTGLLVGVLHRRSPGWRWMLATLISSAGLILLSGVAGGGDGRLDTGGLLASLGAGASFALYAIAAKELMMRGTGSLAAMAVLFGGGAALSLPLLAATDLAWLAEPSGALVALWLGVVTVAAAYVLFGVGLRRLEAPVVSTLALAEPATATLLGVLVLGESLTVAGVGGLVLLVGGLAVLAIPARQQTRGGQESGRPATAGVLESRRARAPVRSVHAVEVEPVATP